MTEAVLAPAPTRAQAENQPISRDGRGLQPRHQPRLRRGFLEPCGGLRPTLAGSSRCSCPSPRRSGALFQQSMAGDLDDHSLPVHFAASIGRVFAAFALAVALGVPVGLAMGVSRIARESSIRRSNSIGRCRLSPICR